MALVDEMTDAQVDEILERYDQTAPALQRRIVCELMVRIQRANETKASLLAACNMALHLVEENNEEIVQMSGSFGLMLELQTAIRKAKGQSTAQESGS